jgi:pimeloyl-ACP methyl ester carboxylesterase
MTLTAGPEAWLAAGRVEEIDTRRVYVRDQAGTGPPVMLMHGFPSSSYDWRHVLAGLPGRRVVAFDFLGFGLSAKPAKHRYSLLAAADLVQRIAERFEDEPVVLAGHDMANSVIAELLARDVNGRLPFRAAAVVMLNGTIVLELGTLTVSQKLQLNPFGSVAARLSTESAFQAQLERTFSRAHPLSAPEAADQWSLLEHGGGGEIVDRLTLFMREQIRYAPRWVGAVRDWPGHLELAWGLQDPVCPKSMLDAVLELRPGAPVTMLPELGHYPHLEDPEAVTEVIARVAEESSALVS